MYEYVVLDLETSIKNRFDSDKGLYDAVGSFKASPFHPLNKIVMAGWYRAGDSHVSTTKSCLVRDATPSVSVLNTDLLVGQNIGFDMLYLLREKSWREWARTGKIWDTMIAEYLLTGQESRYASLDSLAEKYGGTTKPDAIKAYWNEGIDTEDIPEQELEEYLIGDVVNTEIVFKAQLELADRMDMLPLIFDAMEARMATIEMEYNGMYFDIETADKLRADQETMQKATLIKCKSLMTLTETVPFEWNPESPQHLSAFFFGGVIKYDDVEEVLDDEGKPVIYKSGKRKGEIKTRKCKTEYSVHGCLTTPENYSTMGASGQWGTGEAVLKKIAKDKGYAHYIDLAKTLLELRKLNKDISAYYVGLPALTWGTDNCIHPSFNHTATGTGRLSCSNPNLQQMSNG